MKHDAVANATTTAKPVPANEYDDGQPYAVVVHDRSPYAKSDDESNGRSIAKSNDESATAAKRLWYARH